MEDEMKRIAAACVVGAEVKTNLAVVRRVQVRRWPEAAVTSGAEVRTRAQCRALHRLQVCLWAAKTGGDGDGDGDARPNIRSGRAQANLSLEPPRTA